MNCLVLSAGVLAVLLNLTLPMEQIDQQGQEEFRPVEDIVDVESQSNRSKELCTT